MPPPRRRNGTSRRAAAPPRPDAPACWPARPRRRFCAFSSSGRAAMPPTRSDSQAVWARPLGHHGSKACGDISRLLIPTKRGLPPVVSCRGTKPSQAAKSRPRAKLSPWPMAAISAVAFNTPIPGMVMSRSVRRAHIQSSAARPPNPPMPCRILSFREPGRNITIPAGHFVPSDRLRRKCDCS